MSADGLSEAASPGFNESADGEKANAEFGRAKSRSKSKASDKGFERGEVWSAPLDRAEEECIEALIRTWPPSARSAVDVGSGDARVTRHLPSRLFVVKVDRNWPGIWAAPAPKVLGDATNLPVADLSVDVALYSNVLEHLDNDAFATALFEARRVAKSYIAIVGPLAEPLSAARTECVACGTLFHPNGHIQSLSIDDLSRALAPDFVLVEQAITSQVWRMVDSRTQTAEVLMGGEPFAWPHAVCPACARLQHDIVGRGAPPAAAVLRKVVEPVPREARPLETILWFARPTVRRRRTAEGLVVRPDPIEPPAGFSLVRRPRAAAFPDQVLMTHPAAACRGAFLTPDGTVSWGPAQGDSAGHLRRQLLADYAYVVLPAHDLLTANSIAVDFLDEGAGDVHFGLLDATNTWRPLGVVQLNNTGARRLAEFAIPPSWIPPLSAPLLRVLAVAPTNAPAPKPRIGAIGANAQHGETEVASFQIGDDVPPEALDRGATDDLLIVAHGGSVSVRNVADGVSTFWGHGDRVLSPPPYPWKSAPEPAVTAARFEAAAGVGAFALQFANRLADKDCPESAFQIFRDGLRELQSASTSEASSAMSPFLTLLDRIAAMARSPKASE